MLPPDLSPLWLSLEIAALATAWTAFFGILMARLLVGVSLPLRLATETILLCPLVLPPTVLGYGLILLLGRDGLLGRFSANGLLFSTTAAVVAATVVSLPLMYLSARAAFRQVDGGLVDAAQSFGASRWRTLLTIQIPLALPGIAAGILLSFGRSLGEFGATLMVAGNIPGVTQTLPIALYFDVEAANYARAGAWCAIALVTSAVIIGLINFLSERRRSH